MLLYNLFEDSIVGLSTQYLKEVRFPIKLGLSKLDLF